MSIILVTGSNGFVGRHVVAALRNSGRVVGLGSGSVNFPGQAHEYHQMTLPHPDLERLLARLKPATVVHCAGSASVGLSMNHPGVDFQAGPPVIFQLFDGLRKAKLAAPLIFLSSAAIYGNPVRLPVAETDPLAPVSPYGYHKLLCETIAEEFGRIFGLPSILLRVFSCYGPGLRKQLLWDIAEKIAGGRLALSGTGRETRDFIHVADVGRLIAMLVERPCPNATGPMVLNVASGLQTSVAEIAGLMTTSFGLPKLLPEFDGRTRPGDPLYWQADVTGIAKLDFVPSVNLETGVAGYVNWYKKHAHLTDY